MNSLSYLILAGASIMLASCSTAPDANSVREPYVKPGLVMLTADQAAQRGIKISAPDHVDSPPTQPLQPLDASAVAAPPGIKVYTLARGLDPADPELMHEEHVVYRRESTPQWKLDASGDQKILIGPRATDGRQELHPLLEKELTSFLAEQRRATEANQKAITALFAAVETLNHQQQALLRKEIDRAAPASPTPADAAGPKPAEGAGDP